MILTIGPHPSLEKNVLIPGFEPGRAFRLPEVLRLAGSKGFNFTRAMRTLGQNARVIAPLAGFTGQWVSHLAKTEGLDCVEVWVSGETRTILNVVDPERNQTTEFIEAGPVLTAEGWDKFKRAVLEQLPAIQWLVFCGSFVPGTPEDGPSELVEAAASAGVRVVLDTYGPALNHSLKFKPALVKINQHEAAGVLKRDINTPAEAIQAAIEIQSLGPQAVVITLGAPGAVGIDPTGQTFAWASPQVRSLCAVGSGDSFLAGVVTGLVRGQSLKEATRLGIASGAANTLQIGPGQFELAQVEELLTQVQALNVNL